MVINLVQVDVLPRFRPSTFALSKKKLRYIYFSVGRVRAVVRDVDSSILVDATLVPQDYTRSFATKVRCVERTEKLLPCPSYSKTRDLGGRCVYRG